MKKNYFFAVGLFALLFTVFVSCNKEETVASTDPDGEMMEEMENADRRAQLYVTNNADGNITIYDITGGSTKVLQTGSTAAEGIFYDADMDQVVQASRSALQLEAFDMVSSRMDGDAVTPVATGSADLVSPRELAVNGDTFVVSDNGNNQFFVYTKSGGSFTLQNIFDIPFPVWGITFKGGDLYAVVDTVGELAVFYDFLSNSTDGLLRPSKRVTVEGITRTHGLTYDGSDDVMVMTDIGDAANGTDDGAFLLINDFGSKFDLLSDGEVITLEHQIRIEGSATMLGNPIDIAYDSETNAVYISEVGNGKVLGFTSYSSGGNIAPSFTADLMAASSIYFSSDETDGNNGVETMGLRAELYATTVASGEVLVYDVTASTTKRITTESMSSEGIFYSGFNDAIIQASRSELALQYYSGISSTMDGDNIMADFASTMDLVSPREIAVYANKVVVSDNGPNKFFVYTFTNNSFTLTNTFTINCNLWGIAFKGKDLLAVVDQTGDLAVFTDFFSNTSDGVIAPDKQITIEGIVRTHGITYSASDDLLVMTDIGDAANATDDGGFQVIQDFTNKFNAVSEGGTLALSDQIRVAGDQTQMGNPIDVAYDTHSHTIYVTEVGNGKLLEFMNILEGGGNIAPSAAQDFEGASSVYIYTN